VDRSRDPPLVLGTESVSSELLDECRASRGSSTLTRDRLGGPRAGLPEAGTPRGTGFRAQRELEGGLDGFWSTGFAPLRLRGWEGDGHSCGRSSTGEAGPGEKNEGKSGVGPPSATPHPPPPRRAGFAPGVNAPAVIQRFPQLGGERGQGLYNNLNGPRTDERRPKGTPREGAGFGEAKEGSKTRGPSFGTGTQLPNYGTRARTERAARPGRYAFANNIRETPTPPGVFTRHPTSDFQTRAADHAMEGGCVRRNPVAGTFLPLRRRADTGPVQGRTATNVNIDAEG